MLLKNLKICGITTPDIARFCADAGVGALGAVFFAKSPRNVSAAQARAIFDGIPSGVARVGVFVNATADAMLAIAREAGLTTIQLHGGEPAEVVAVLLDAGYRVVKVVKRALDSAGAIAEEIAAIPAGAGVLVECGAGNLPGGNGAAWDWSAAAPLARMRPFALAGGIDPRNVVEALRCSHAVACDVSSGVESAPGVKDHGAILKLVEAVRKSESENGEIGCGKSGSETANVEWSFWLDAPAKRLA